MPHNIHTGQTRQVESVHIRFTLWLPCHIWIDYRTKPQLGADCCAIRHLITLFRSLYTWKPISTRWPLYLYPYLCILVCFLLRYLPIAELLFVHLRIYLNIHCVQSFNEYGVMGTIWTPRHLCLFWTSTKNHCFVLYLLYLLRCVYIKYNLILKNIRIFRTKYKWSSEWQDVWRTYRLS